MRRITLGLILTLFLTQTAVAQEEPGMVSTKRMTMPTALMIAQATVAACTEMGIQIGVTVVDREGIVQVTLRDTIAAQITVPISERKAYTAANFNAATSALGDRANSPVGRAPKILMSAGGLPIEVGGALVGAVGVSGAPSGETDEQCAQAGIDAVIDDLEMAM
ncbi:MAG: heme-binding protein [Gammaproteobacteria bacterium]|nr:heme-binding protein [Gammaproteobacteria bacterium]